jgi:glycosyltransferase involved in cell wall biosynthesis
MVNKYYSPPHLGGVETVVATLSAGLAARGHRVRALVANEERRTMTEAIDGVEVTRLAPLAVVAKTPIALGMASAIRRAAAESDVVQLNYPYPWGEASWLASGANAPMVIGYHADVVRQKRLLALYGPIMRRVFDRAAAIAVSSPDIVKGSDVLRPYAGKCRVVPYGIEPSRYEPTPEIVRRAAGLRAEHHGRPVILFVGRLVYYKGADVLVRAMADLDADLVVVGDGPMAAGLRSLADELGVSQRVTWTPSLPFDELVAHYRCADVLALPSTSRAESFGIVQLEAQICGVPCVSSDVPTSVPFVNLDGVTGLTVPAGDVAALAGALRTLLADDELRARMGAAARERVLRDFTVERMCAGYVDIYREVCGGTAPGRAPANEEVAR